MATAFVERFGVKVSAQIVLTAGTTTFRVNCSSAFELYVQNALVSGAGAGETVQVHVSCAGC